MVELVFRDPPDPPVPVSRTLTLQDFLKNQDRSERIAVLAQHPDRWAVISEHLSRSSAYKAARVLTPRHPGYEFVARMDPDGRGVVYGRYTARSP
jgi:hypothetical protein